MEHIVRFLHAEAHNLAAALKGTVPGAVKRSKRYEPTRGRVILCARCWIVDARESGLRETAHSTGQAIEFRCDGCRTIYTIPF